jgi:hypothetical protein
VLKPIWTRKGSVQNAVDTSMASKEYQILYRFPQIRVGGIVNKLKKHFTVVTAAGVPTCGFLKFMDVISIDTVTVFISLGMMPCLSLLFLLSVGCEAKTEHVGTLKYGKGVAFEGQRHIIAD